jgi:dienelactone hydrolase
MVFQAQDLTQTDRLLDFDKRQITFNENSKVVYVGNPQLKGPAVIVMTEMPGISPYVARFSRWVMDAGFTVYMPSLFGLDGVVASANEGAEVFKKACVSAEFRAFASHAKAQSSPVTQWLMQLARLAHSECGGPGVGAIGMCFTGNFALTMMLEPSVIAPVLSQPSLPMNNPAGIEISDDDVKQVKQRLDRDNLTVLAYRFDGDRFCTKERFNTYRQALGDRFISKVLPDAAANTNVPPFFAEHVATPHSVVTAHLIDEAGQPTILARDEILTFFRQRLGP